MINTLMQNTTPCELASPEEKKPNENYGLYFSSAIRITDPETKEILVETRGD